MKRRQNVNKAKHETSWTEGQLVTSAEFSLDIGYG